ncbi:MAG TPA: hypothetical protein VFD39_11145 [Trueperaceae bacterium]|nr:hypothetical protein [Trueperaceae bacterium]
MELSSVTAVFEHPSTARDAEAALVNAGLGVDDVAVIPGESEETLRGRRLASPNHTQRALVPPDVGAAVGFTLGFLGGGFFGLLLGAGVLNIMGKEPAMAVGPFWSAVIGAAVLGLSGAIAGFVFNAPLPDLDPAPATSRAARKLTILSVGAPADREREVVELLERYGPSRLQVWRRDGGSWLPAPTPG